MNNRENIPHIHSQHMMCVKLADERSVKKPAHVCFSTSLSERVKKFNRRRPLFEKCDTCEMKTTALNQKKEKDDSAFEMRAEKSFCQV